MALTDEDKQFIKTVLDDVLEFKLEGKVKEYIGALPTREEFNSRMDEMMGELKTIRIEQSFLAQHSKDHTDDIQKLKNIHPHGMHNYAMS
ncbi:MAG: hypothetical protein ACD_19C00429G0068 [uncultured bacterium]|nr:MAG: hypothetical protein ACD_19C00429G0068 [uncultured bacterium]